MHSDAGPADATESAVVSAPARNDQASSLALLMIVAATFWAYWPCLNGSFIWDDYSYVRDNPLLHDWNGLWRIWSEPTATSQYHPLVFTSFWIEYHLWGLAPLGYHIVNVALHSADCVLLWLLLRRLQVPGALLAAGVFALHPVHVESVAWVTERKDVLSGLFYALTMLAWVGFVEHRKQRDWLLMLLFGTLTLLSKSVLITLPGGLALIALWRDAPRWRSWGARLLPLFGLSAVMTAVTVWREHAQGNPPLGYSALERWLIAGAALWQHVAALLWPVNLTIVYPKWEVSISDPLAYLFPLAVPLVLAMLFLGRRKWGNGPLIGVGFYVLTLSPMLGLVDYNIMQWSFVSDHFQYVASAGLIAVISAALADRTKHLPAEQRHGLGAALLAVLALLSWWQSGLYVDAQTIWRDNIVKNPRSWTGYANLAAALAHEGKHQEAAAELEKALAVNPNYVAAHIHLGIILAALQKPQEAITHFEAALTLDPTRADAENNLGTVLVTLGRVGEAQAHFIKALQNNPGYAEAWRHLAIVAVRLGKREEAITFLQEALRLRPDFAAAKTDLDTLTHMKP